MGALSTDQKGVTIGVIGQADVFTSNPGEFNPHDKSVWGFEEVGSRLPVFASGEFRAAGPQFFVHSRKIEADLEKPLFRLSRHKKKSSRCVGSLEGDRVGKLGAEVFEAATAQPGRDGATENAAASEEKGERRAAGVGGHLEGAKLGKVRVWPVV